MIHKRSYLFVPANKLEMIEKAIYSNADCIIIDLEDSVAISEKESARETVIRALQLGDGNKSIYVRINDMSTEYWAADTAIAVLYGASGLMVPKAESKKQMESLCCEIRQVMEKNGQKRKFHIIPLVETAKGLVHIEEIASADAMIERIAFGSLDFALDIDCQLTEEGLELVFARSQIVIASRAAGLESPIDTVYPDLHDEAGLVQEAKFARQLGFKGKLLIHPKQIDPVHHVFLPTNEEIKNYEEIVTAFEKAEKQGVAAISVNNKMVDYPVYRKAKEMLSLLKT